MRKLILGLLLFLFLIVGCGPPPSGNIRRKEYIPAHTETGTTCVMIGEQMVWLPTVEYVPDKWYFHFDKGRREVGKETFEKFHEGELYGVEQ